MVLPAAPVVPSAGRPLSCHSGGAKVSAGRRRWAILLLLLLLLLCRSLLSQKLQLAELTTTQPQSHEESHQVSSTGHPLVIAMMDRSWPVKWFFL